MERCVFVGGFLTCTKEAVSRVLKKTQLIGVKSFIGFKSMHFSCVCSSAFLTEKLISVKRPIKIYKKKYCTTNGVGYISTEPDGHIGL